MVLITLSENLKYICNGVVGEVKYFSVGKVFFTSTSMTNEFINKDFN